MGTRIRVSATLFAAIAATLRQHGHGEWIDGNTIHAGGGTVFVSDEPRDLGVTIQSLVSSRDQQGKVDLVVGSEIMQLDVAKARVIHDMLGGAIEAAISDEAFVRFLTADLGMAFEATGPALVRLRELRQGSRDVVNPH